MKQYQKYFLQKIVQKNPQRNVQKYEQKNLHTNIQRKRRENEQEKRILKNQRGNGNIERRTEQYTEQERKYTDRRIEKRR